MDFFEKTQLKNRDAHGFECSRGPSAGPAYYEMSPARAFHPEPLGDTDTLDRIFMPLDKFDGAVLF